MPDCLFCKIIARELPSKKVYEDDQTYAFEDIKPHAPIHVLIAPKKHIVGLKEAEEGDAELLGHIQLIAARLARQFSLENGYRTILNVGPDAGQSVFHLHLHLLGGKKLNELLG